MEPNTYQAPSKTSKKPLIFVSLLAVLSFGAALVLGMLYFNKSEPQNTTQNVVKKSEPVEAQKISLFDTSQVDELYSDLDKPKENTTYNAQVGKFSLQLPNWLGVIQKMDGGGEGSIETNIQVGIRDGGLIALPPVPFEIRAIRALHDENLSTSDQFKKYLKDYGNVDIDDTIDYMPKPTEEAIDFAGNKAFKYTQENAYFNESYTVFQRGDLIYIIHTDVDREAMVNIQEIVESNIKFN